MNEKEIYQKVYGQLANKVLPAFAEATEELAKENYPNIGEFIINSLGGLNATVLSTSINATAEETTMPKSKVRKKVLKDVSERSSLFLKRLDELHKQVAQEEKATV